jgi:uncharacterized MAPEG superfamily protein
MEIFTGSIELQLLFWSVVLGLVQLVIATALATRDQGLAYNLSARDLPAPPVTVLTGRFGRAFGNFRETFVYFAVAVLLVSVLVKESELSAWGAHLYFWSRLVYVPVYAVGIPVLRTVVWTMSILGLVLVLLSVVA